MPSAAKPQTEALEQAARRFERWRRRRTGWRIPEPLWKRAAALARRYGIHRTAQALRLNYAHLKAQAAAARSREGQALDGGAPFVELFPASAGECVVAYERSDGGKMRIELKMSLGRAFPLLAGDPFDRLRAGRGRRGAQAERD